MRLNSWRNQLVEPGALHQLIGTLASSTSNAWVVQCSIIGWWSVLRSFMSYFAVGLQELVVMKWM